MASGMVLPELYAAKCHTAVVYTTYLLNKYRHLINWTENAAILEYGFGDGTNFQKSLLSLLPKDYKEFVATDISHKMLDFARKNVSTPRIKFEELAINCINLPNNYKNRFNLVFSFFTNHLVRNPKQMFKNIHSMLKTGGQTFIITFKHSPLDIIFHNLSTHPKWGKYGHEKVISPYYYDSDPKMSMAKDLIEGGFTTGYFREEQVSHEFENEAEWQGLYFSANPVLPNIPIEDIAEYERDYYNEIRKHVIFKDDDVTDTKFYKVKFTLYIICDTKST